MSSAAALQLQPRSRPTTVRPGPGSPRRPSLRVFEGGRAPERLARQAIYRRRRLVALALLAVVVVAALVLANALEARISGGGTPGPVAGTSSPAVRIVQPGDTLWSIARGLEGDVDVRLVVDRLVDLNGHAALTVGQRLQLP